MIERIYGQPGGISRRGMTPSAIPWARAAQPPAFDGAVAAEWNPVDDVETSDPHDQPAFTVGDGPPTVGPTPDNIEGGGSFAVDADFSGGYDSGSVPDNIIVD